MHATLAIGTAWEGEVEQPIEPAPAAPPSVVGRAEATDVELVRAFCAGDSDAFGEIVRRYGRPVYRLALRYARDADEADELAQRTFLRALSGAGGLTDGSGLKPWLFRIAANLCKNHLRDRARLVFGLPLDLAVPEGGGLEHEERRARVREALARLPTRQRQVVSLRVDAELPFSDVARALGITENNAKVTYHHAVRGLRKRLAGEDL